MKINFKIKNFAGLSITLGAALIIIARRLSKMNLYMKQLDVADTLGTITVLMCDKTGIFTSNDKTVTDLWFNLEFHKGNKLIFLFRFQCAYTMEKMRITGIFASVGVYL